MAGGGYPFAFIAPKIDYSFTICLTRRSDGSVKLDASGGHNEFPAYELIVNGEVLYKDYPTSEGPGLLNLAVFFDVFTATTTLP